MLFRSSSSSTALLVAAIAATTLAAPIAERIVGTETCTKRTSGYLTGANGQKFAISKDGSRVVNANSGSGGLEVEFQSCDPNFNKWSNSGDGPYGGHIYVPRANKCLHVPSYNPNVTYKLELQDCYYSNDSGQFAYNFLQKGSDYYWSGATMSDASIIQGQDNECSDGLFGYQSGEGGAVKTSGTAVVACASGKNVQTFKIGS
ncbi:putative effector protein [Ceratobasidium theobromae]|uniref:Putative effector protein n=1 Tax=Ceratobasidium theobromae TaxID=1582974 RepID=A0A5N5QN64_9AGAM|nr:putative effector protein [Ceratobasidium theobromae]